MPENKTRPTDASVQEFLEGVDAIAILYDRDDPSRSCIVYR